MPRPESYSGMWTCREQFESGLLHFVSRIRDRCYVAVDEEHGVVAALVFFDHDAGKSRTFQTPSGRTVNRRPDHAVDLAHRRDLQGGEGLLHEIELCSSARPTA